MMLLLHVAACVALRIEVPKAAVPCAAATMCAAVIAATPFPSLAAPTINEAIIEVSETSYPIIKSLRSETFGPFSEKAAKLFLDINPDKLGKSIGLGIDVLTSAPPAEMDTFNDVVKAAFTDLSPTSCTLVPLPPKSLADKLGAIAAEKVEPEKLKAFADVYGKSLGTLPTEGDKICLPPLDKLDKLALAQADLARSFNQEQSTRFAAYTAPVLKSSISLGKVLPLVGDAKRLTPTATPAQLSAFQQAGKRVEAASAAEANRVKYEALRARSEALAAAKAAGKPAPLAASSPTANPVLKEELEAAAKARAEEAAAIKQAATKAAAARKQELQEAELERIAELKRKSAAIKAAKEAQ